ncbi:MAG: hypothetical protein HY619_02710 [Thaumarchaeota archaeon]|nr:hypothetical protein [Nitrososphaerota archaeon]
MVYLEGKCLEKLLNAQSGEQGWFLAAPGYGPYGNYVWHRDNAECVMALDEYARTFDQKWLFERTGKALVRSFDYLAEKEKGVQILRQLSGKFQNPAFVDQNYHPHARLTSTGEEIKGPWNNIQYDSIARLLIALGRHLSIIPDGELMEKCRAGVKVALTYLFDAIWEEVEGRRWLTVCANEWEEKEQPHLRNPLFSSVIGLINAASRIAQEHLEEWLWLRDVELGECERITEKVLQDFVVDGKLRMIKRFNEPAVGSCSTSLWLFTTYGVFPIDSDLFRKTLHSLMSNLSLCSESEVNGEGHRPGVKGLRRYAIERGGDTQDNGGGYMDSYWGGQAWLITTAQLASAHAMLRDMDRAEDLLRVCMQVANSEGMLPEQFDGTYHSRAQYEAWKIREAEPAPAQWLAWSHAEVLRAYARIRANSIGL